MPPDMMQIYCGGDFEFIKTLANYMPINKPLTYLDAGSNIGMASVLFTHSIMGNGQVIAVDANPETVKVGPLSAARLRAALNSQSLEHVCGSAPHVCACDAAGAAPVLARSQSTAAFRCSTSCSSAAAGPQPTAHVGCFACDTLHCRLRRSQLESACPQRGAA